MPFRYWIIITLIGAAFGGAFFFNAILLEELGPLTISMSRIALGAVACWGFVLLRRKSLALPSIVWVQIFGLGLVQYAIPFAALPLSQQHISSGMAGTINGMTPAFVVLIAHVWAGGERATAPKIMGVGLGFAGIAILSWPALQSGTAALLPITVALVAPLSYAFALNYGRVLRGIDPIVVTALALTMGAVTIAPLAISIEGLPQVHLPQTYLALAVQGFLLTGIGFMVVFSILPKTGPTAASTITLIAPVSAVMLGTTILGETLSHAHVTGMVIILAGLVVIDGRLLKYLRNRPQPLPA